MIKEISSPFTVYEHEVFKKTFLQSVNISALLDSPEPLDQAALDMLVEYAKATFNADPPERKDNNALAVTTESEEIRYDFDAYGAKFYIKGHRYISFADSLNEPIANIARYYEQVMQRETIEELVLKKTNIWMLEDEGIDEIPPTDELASLIFQKKWVKKLVDADEGASASYVRQDFPLNDDATLSLQIISRTVDRLPVFQMESEVKWRGVPVDELHAALQEANTVLYDCYVNTISDGMHKFQKSDDDALN